LCLSHPTTKAIDAMSKGRLVIRYMDEALVNASRKAANRLKR
jgi:hypothetical protein